MKKLLLLAIFSTISLFAFSQQETIFNSANNISGWGGPMLEISTINGETVVDVGGGGALIIDNFFFGGYGLGTDAPNIEIAGETYDIDNISGACLGVDNLDAFNLGINVCAPHSGYAGGEN